MFLGGLGSALAIPLLPSLLERDARAADGAPLRYIQFITNTGVDPARFFPARTGMQDLGGGVMGKRLSTITGDMSFILNAPLDPFRNKLTVIRGLDCLQGDAHNTGLPTSASGNNAYGIGSFPYTVDSILATSAKVYPSAAGKQRQVCVSPYGSYQGNFSFNTVNGKTSRPDLVAGTATTPTTGSLLSLFGFDAPAAPTPNDPMQAVLAKAMKDTYGDFKAVRDGSRISGADKQRLDGYMTLIDEVANGGGAGAQACKKPVPNVGTDRETLYVRNSINVLAAALSCGLTNVVSYVLPVSGGGDDPMHVAAHHIADNGKSELHSTGMRRITAHVAYFLKLLDSALDATGGTVLDNSIFYYGNEFGSLEPFNAHVPFGMPVLVAGGGGGALSPGYFLDYGTTTVNGNVRATGTHGYYNNLLVTFMNAMGLGSTDYERGGIAGFGSYASKPDMPTAKRRQPLPIFYKGPARG